MLRLDDLFSSYAENERESRFQNFSSKLVIKDEPGETAVPIDFTIFESSQHVHTSESLNVLLEKPQTFRIESH